MTTNYESGFADGGVYFYRLCGLTFTRRKGLYDGVREGTP